MYGKSMENGTFFPDLEKVWNFRGDSLKYGKSMEFHELGLEMKVEETERKKGKGNLKKAVARSYQR